MTPAEVIAAARSMVGTPFRHQSRIESGAVDCAGTLVAICAALNQQVADQTGYARRPSGSLLESAIDAQPALSRVMPPALAGDFVLMKFEQDKAASHLGVVTGPTLIHAWAVAKKVCEHAFDAEWQRRVVRVYRFKEMTHGE